MTITITMTMTMTMTMTTAHRTHPVIIRNVQRIAQIIEVKCRIMHLQTSVICLQLSSKLPPAVVIDTVAIIVFKVAHLDGVRGKPAPLVEQAGPEHQA